MKNLATFVLVLVLTIIGNTKSANAAVASDTIIKVEGKIMPVDVVKVTSTYVRFKIDGNDELFTLNRKEIHKIIYENGRIEEYNPMVMIMIDEFDWKAVWLTENEEDVVSLYKRGEIEAVSSPSSRSPKAAKKNATMRLQKSAAAKQGIVVLVTSRKSTGGYGEPPGYKIEGVAYGTEPLEEEDM